MIEMTQAEVDEAIRVAHEIVEMPKDDRAKVPEWRPLHIINLARAVLHLAERDRQNTAIIELGLLAVKDAEERCAAKLAEAHRSKLE